MLLLAPIKVSGFVTGFYSFDSNIHQKHVSRNDWPRPPIWRCFLSSLLYNLYCSWASTLYYGPFQILHARENKLWCKLSLERTFWSSMKNVSNAWLTDSARAFRWPIPHTLQIWSQKHQNCSHRRGDNDV